MSAEQTGDRVGRQAAAVEAFRRMFPRFESEAARYEHYARRRRDEPVHRDPEQELWGVYRYDDVRRVLAEHGAFSSQAAFVPPDPPAATPADPAAHGTETGARRPGGLLRETIIGTDPPRHTQLRGLVTRAFTPRAVAGMEALARRLARQAIEPALDRGWMDVSTELGGPLPVTIIATLLGLPEDDAPRYRGWAETFNQMQDPTAADADGQAAQGRFMRFQDELDGYFGPLIEAKRRRPGEDLISQLILARLDGAGLSPDDLLSFCELLLLAGFVTTTNLIANGIWLLGEHPRALADLRADPARVPVAVEEFLRFCSPVQAMVRRTVTPVEVGGRRIPAGARVVAWIGSANRDEAVFPDPARFAAAREPNPHLAFGSGIHFCLGAPLARLEGRIVFEELTSRVREIGRLGDHPVEFSVGFIHGVSRLRMALRGDGSGPA